MKKQILLVGLLTLVAASSFAAAKAGVVAKCTVASAKNGDYDTVLGTFNVVRYGSPDPDLDGAEAGVLYAEAYDGAHKDYAKKTTGVEFNIQKDPEEGFYRIEAFGMTRNRGSEAKVLVKTEALPLSLELYLISSESDTKATHTAKAQQAMGWVRLSCAKVK